MGRVQTVGHLRDPPALVNSLLPAGGYAAGRIRAHTNLGVRLAAVVSSRLLELRDRRPSARPAYCGDHMRGTTAGARALLLKSPNAGRHDPRPGQRRRCLVQPRPTRERQNVVFHLAGLEGARHRVCTDADQGHAHRANPGVSMIWVAAHRLRSRRFELWSRSIGAPSDIGREQDSRSSHPARSRRDGEAPTALWPQHREMPTVHPPTTAIDACLGTVLGRGRRVKSSPSTAARSDSRPACRTTRPPRP